MKLRVGGYWWKGYSPYDYHGEKLNVLHDALLIFENDVRFYEHVQCFSRIFGVDHERIVEDYYHLKDLKSVNENNAIFVERNGNQNWTSLKSCWHEQGCIYHDNINSWNQCLKS